MNSGDVLHRLRGHDDEIQCLTWEPLDLLPKSEGRLVPSQGKPTRTRLPVSRTYVDCPMLLSSARDKTFRIWEITEQDASLWSKVLLPVPEGTWSTQLVHKGLRAICRTHDTTAEESGLVGNNMVAGRVLVFWPNVGELYWCFSNTVFPGL